MSVWTPTEVDLQNLTPVLARGMVERCFFEAQKETLERTRKSLGTLPSDESLRKDVGNIVRAVFLELGIPETGFSGKDLERVVMGLGAKAAAWGTPEDIIQAHQGTLRRILQAVV